MPKQIKELCCMATDKGIRKMFDAARICNKQKKKKKKKGKTKKKRRNSNSAKIHSHSMFQKPLESLTDILMVYLYYFYYFIVS